MSFSKTKNVNYNCFVLIHHENTVRYFCSFYIYNITTRFHNRFDILYVYALLVRYDVGVNIWNEPHNIYNNIPWKWKTNVCVPFPVVLSAYSRVSPAAPLEAVSEKRTRVHCGEWYVFVLGKTCTENNVISMECQIWCFFLPIFTVSVLHQIYPIRDNWLPRYTHMYTCV